MSGLSKAEYLKKYMSDASDTKPKKRRKKVQNSVPAKKVIKSRLVDDDVDFASTLPKETIDPYAAEEEPTVADVIDERPQHVQELEKYRNEKWKQLNTSKKSRHDSDSDDHSPIRRARHDSDSSQSNDDDEEQLMKSNRHDSDSDQSPKRCKSDSDQSPLRHKETKQGSDSDLSPVRQKSNGTRKSRVKNSDSDQSPVRHKKHNSNSDSDQSPKRKKEYDSDQSPPRKSHRAENEKKAIKTSSGAKAGLSSAKEMRDEIEKLRKKEKKSFEAMADARTGKNAATVIRDKSGKIVDMHEEMKKDREKKQKEEKYSKWSKGLKQQELQQASVDDVMHEMSKPLARYQDDADLDAALKDQDREGDPMLAFMKSKKTKKKGPSLPKYSGPPPPPNRFGIPPGYRWDGVDRFNGFEKKFFEQLNAKKARSHAAFKWSTEDM